MARRRRLKTLPEDLISELPVEVKDRILECLPTRDAARTALLSTIWNDVWLKHGRLAFDWGFFDSVQQCRRDDEGRTLVNIIDNILSFRVGPVKKFSLAIKDNHPKPQQSDFDRWCLFLSRNGVEEFNISLYGDVGAAYKLPLCLLSCRTIKQLIVQGPHIDLPVNGCGIFSNVTSLAFLYVDFKRSVNGVASSISIPKLEKLAFKESGGINKFEISSPKLEILSVTDCMYDVVEWRWLAPYLKAIKTLSLGGSLLALYDFSFGCEKQLPVAMQLLQKCPNLCELHIRSDESGWIDDTEAASRLLEDPEGCFVIPELKTLNTIKIELFTESALKMLFLRMMLSITPALERVVLVVTPWDMDASEVSDCLRALECSECFPRASPNAQIVCMRSYDDPMREDWLDTHGFSLFETEW